MDDPSSPGGLYASRSDRNHLFTKLTPRGYFVAVTIYYDADADLGRLKGRKIAVIGYGSQGHAHSLNLKDSGLDVVVGLYKGSKSWKKAAEAGLRVATVEEAADAADMIMMLVPDQTQKSLYENSIKRALRPGKTLMFAHGFNVHFNQVVAP